MTRSRQGQPDPDEQFHPGDPVTARHGCGNEAVSVNNIGSEAPLSRCLDR